MSTEPRFVYRPGREDVIDRKTGRWMGIDLAREYAAVVNAVTPAQAGEEVSDAAALEAAMRQPTIRELSKLGQAPGDAAFRALTLGQISEIARDAQIAFCLNKYSSFEVAFARLLEDALALRKGAV